ncbi:hypothetical protein [Vibrio owensii]|uniref:hypothetical protein n=1 Tax=Vibrio owensii TaxID=696485 RepID=UPI0018F22A4A|nr:hypothetical protein [Vibrio owensii]
MVKNSNKLAVAAGALLFVTLAVQANADRFNSIKSGMSRTNSVTSQSGSTPSGSDFNNAVLDQDNKYGSSYDDTDLSNRVKKLEQDFVSKSYIDGQDDSHMNSAKSYSNSVASSAESRAKSHADSRASQAESNAKSYANTVSSSAESNAKSYANTRATQAETASKSYAQSLVLGVTGKVDNNSREIVALWAAIDSIQVGGGGGGSSKSGWWDIPGSNGASSISFPNDGWTRWEMRYRYTKGDDRNSATTVTVTSDGNDGGQAWGVSFSKSCDVYGGGRVYSNASWSIPSFKQGGSFNTPADAFGSSISGQYGCGGRAKLSDFKIENVKLYYPG